MKTILLLIYNYINTAKNPRPFCYFHILVHDYQDSVLLYIKCKAEGIDAVLVGRRDAVPVSRVVVAVVVITTPTHTRVSATARRVRKIFCTPFSTI